MITNEERIAQAQEQLEILERALAALRDQVLPINPARFRLMAEGYVADILQLRSEIDELTGLSLAEAGRAPVWLRVEGDGIEWGDTPASVLTAMLDIFRKGVQTVAEFISTGHVSARPTAEIKRSCDFRVVAFAPGSLRIGLKLPDPEWSLEQPLGRQQPSAAEQALADYLKVAQWASSEGSTEALSECVSDPLRRRLILNELNRLVPRSRGDVAAVTLSGTVLGAGYEARLSKGTREPIGRAIEAAEQEEIVEYLGDLREIDLDKLSFTLRNVDQDREVPCEFGEELLQTAQEALDRRVRVRGIRRKEAGRRRFPPVRVSHLEILEGEDMGDPGPDGR